VAYSVFDFVCFGGAAEEGLSLFVELLTLLGCQNHWSERLKECCGKVQMLDINYALNSVPFNFNPLTTVGELCFLHSVNNNMIVCINVSVLLQSFISDSRSRMCIRQWPPRLAVHIFSERTSRYGIVLPHQASFLEDGDQELDDVFIGFGIRNIYRSTLVFVVPIRSQLRDFPVPRPKEVSKTYRKY
jgi:hypothetical protein